MIRTLAIALCVALAVLVAQTARLHRVQRAVVAADAALAQARAAAESQARETERRLVDAAVDAADQYERGKSDAQTAADALLVDLLHRNLGLHARWQCPPVAVVPATAATARQLDAADADRAASASRIVGAAKACEAQVTALQNFIRAEREVLR